MTRENARRDDDRPARRSDGPRPITDGGPSRSGLFDAFPDPLVSYAVEADAPVVRAVNPAFERTFDVDAATVTGDSLADHLLVDAVEVDPSPNDGGAVRTDAGGSEATAEAVLSRLDAGERITLGTRRGGDGKLRHFRLGTVSDADGDTENCIVYTDVTDLARRMRNLDARAERLERFMSVAAHDLRNPLDVAEIRLEAARDTGEAVHFDKVDTALERIQHIIQDVLSVGGAGVEPSGGTALDEIAEAAWSTVDTAAATLVLEDDLTTIEADADRLQQLFENLFRNAVEHGGRNVTVTVGSLSNGSASSDEAGQGARRTAGGFFVADDGPGIPPKERDRAFDPGYSTADDNTGLGLAIVQQIAEDHGWQVALTAGAAGGARFEFVGVETDD